VGNEAKDDPSKTPRLLMGLEEVTKLKKPASCMMMMMIMMVTIMLIIRILYPRGDGIVQIVQIVSRLRTAPPRSCVELGQETNFISVTSILTLKSTRFRIEFAPEAV
jgi:hypothetical protein